MKRSFVTLVLVLLVFALVACNDSNSKSNTISAVELTDRENMILSTTSDQSFVFDFKIGSEYKEISVWIEKYEVGELVDDRLSHITTEVEESGSIMFAKTETGDKVK